MPEKEEFVDSVEQILKVIETSAAIAIAESKALGLPVVYLKGKDIVKEYADGRIEVLKTLDLPDDAIDQNGKDKHAKKGDK